jgi:hypothetical protein
MPASSETQQTRQAKIVYLGSTEKARVRMQSSRANESFNKVGSLSWLGILTQQSATTENSRGGPRAGQMLEHLASTPFLHVQKSSYALQVVR